MNGKHRITRFARLLAGKLVILKGEVDSKVNLFATLIVFFYFPDFHQNEFH